jgi:Icc protein
MDDFILKNLKKYSILLLCFLLFSCDNLFQFNPNQIVLKDSEKNLNSKNVQRIQSLPVPDTLRFILMGDTQRWYDESADFVTSANQQLNISFVIHAGDISDFGLSQEFKWVNEIMARLKYPYVTVIGNHDIVANGPDAYTKMYGQLDYSFEFGDNKFIFINTNSLEYGLDGSTPNIPWLRSELANNPRNKKNIVIGHVPPFDADFDKNLEKEYTKTLADGNVKFTLYGHQHAYKDGEFYGDGVHYYLTTNIGARGYLIITTWKNGYSVDKVNY